jgi:lipopolysaccharide exporter
VQARSIFAGGIIREIDPDPSFFDTAFTLNLIRGLIASAAVFAVATFFGSAWMPESSLEILSALAILPILNGFDSPRIVVLERQLQYGKIMLTTSVCKALSVAAGIMAATILGNYWAFFATALVLRSCEMVASHLIAPYRPRFTLQRARHLLSFSFWMFGTNITETFERQISLIIVGSKFGSVSSAYISVAREITTIVSDDILASIARVLYPALSNFAHDMRLFRENVLKSIETVTLISVPLCFGLATVADPFLRLVMTDKFLPSVILLQIIAPAYTFQALAPPTRACAQATGRTRTLFIARLVTALCSIPIILILIAQYQLLGAAIGISIGFVISAVVNLSLLKIITGAKIHQMIKAPVKNIFCGAVMVLAIHQISPYLLIQGEGVSTELVLAWELVVKAIIGAATYIGIVFAVWHCLERRDSVEADIVSSVRLTLGRLRNRAGSKR